ncbi:MAG: hypothetical protein SOI56_07785 [Eubacteriales bacterium]|jgi:hypothetical protein
MSELIHAIWEEIRTAYAGNLLLPLYLASLVYLFFADRDKRKILIGPSVILMLVIYNPWLYGKINEKFLSGTYWRAFWLIPVIPVIACAAVHLLTTLPKKWMKGLAAVSLAVIIIGGGTCVYLETNQEFTRTTNIYKIPQEAVDVCDVLLQKDSEPYVVMDSRLFCYTRQYSADIHQMYGRDALGFIDYIQPEEKSVYDQLSSESPDFCYVAEVMREKGYSWLVRYAEDPVGDVTPGSAGFELTDTVDGYNIYRLADQ